MQEHGDIEITDAHDDPGLASAKLPEPARARRSFAEWWSDAASHFRRHRHFYRPVATCVMDHRPAANPFAAPQKETVIVSACFCSRADQYVFQVVPGSFALAELTGPDKPPMFTTASLAEPKPLRRGGTPPNYWVPPAMEADIHRMFTADEAAVVTGHENEGYYRLAGPHTRFAHSEAHITAAAQELDPNRQDQTVASIAEKLAAGDTEAMGALEVLLDTAASVVTGWPQMKGAPFGTLF